MRKKVYLILLLVTVLALGVWTASPARNVAAQLAQDQTSACDHASTFLVGSLAELPRTGDLIHDICDFRIRVNEIPSNVSEFDHHFIEAVIAGNMLEIQSLEIALENATDEEWRGLIQAMITMHTSDLEMALSVAEKIGADTEPDLTDVTVYPETPAYDLGKRRIDLVARFLDPLMNAAGPGGTPTTVPTDTGTVLPTETGTSTATGVPTNMSTVTVTSTPNASSGHFVSLFQATDTPTATATALPTDTATATETATALPTDTATATETATVLPTDTATPTETATGLPTDTATETATAIATATATGSPTVVPPTITPGPDAGAEFDLLAMEVIEDEHAMSIEAALVAQRLVRNDEVRAFAKHAADVAHLHMMLMDALKYRLAYNITLPPPRFREDYQSPRRFEP